MFGILRERAIMAKNVDSLNMSFKGAVDFDGGNVMALADGTDDVFTATAPVTGKLKGLAMAYNPSVRLWKIDGQVYAGMSCDERAYTNLAGKVGDCFIPQVGDEIGLFMEGIDGSVAPTVGKFLEASNGKKTLAIASAQTEGVLSFEVVKIVNEGFPKAGIGMDYKPMYVCRCRAN